MVPGGSRCPSTISRSDDFRSAPPALASESAVTHASQSRQACSCSDMRTSSNDNGGAPRGRRSVERGLVPGYGQVTSISKGLFTGCSGFAMSTPTAVPEIL